MLRWLPEDVSPYGAGIDSLFYIIYYITAAAFILVTVLMVLFLFIYRHREGRRAVYTHGNTTLELVWTVVPALVFIGLGFASKAKWDEIKLNVPDTDVVVQVTAKQFNWEILYPGPDGKFNTEDDKQIDNDIHVPVGKPIRVILKARDVIHSFFLPVMRVKQDAIPGMRIPVWFEATKTGTYEVACAQLCGNNHYSMRALMYIQQPTDFEKWLAEKSKPPEEFQD